MSTPPVYRIPEPIVPPSRSDPLNRLYSLGGRTPPDIAEINTGAVPEPYRGLLVHTGNMTPTLEDFHRQKIDVSVINRHVRGEIYSREVILLTRDTSVPVEFAAIEIHLELFPWPARCRILEERTPLGTILSDFGIPNSNWPRAYLRVNADSFMRGALQLRSHSMLYGRRTTLLDVKQRSLAEVVEIVPPIDHQSSVHSPSQ